MKAIALLAVVLMSVGAFAREVNSQIKIFKGPFNIPAKGSSYNILGPDVYTKGKVSLYMTESSIEVHFPRSELLSLAAVQDKNAPDYYYTTANAPKVRVGFEGENLTWFYAQQGMWRVGIDEDADKSLLEPIPFAKMSNHQLIEIAKDAVEKTDAGYFNDDAKVKRAGGSVTVTGDVEQMGQDQDDSTVVGKATITFDDVSRTISVHASITDL